MYRLGQKLAVKAPSASTAAAAARVERWEATQARVAFLLPIIRAVELGFVSLVLAATVLYANAEGGVLLELARNAWGPSQRPGALFAPTFTSLALVVGFFAGPYVDAARRMRSDAAEYAAVARKAVRCRATDRSGFTRDYEKDGLDELLGVVKASHDFISTFDFDTADRASLAKAAPAFAHYWDKRAGSATITPDARDPVKRDELRWSAIRTIALCAVGAALTTIVFVAFMAESGPDDRAIPAAGLSVLFFAVTAKRQALPLRPN